MVGCGALGDINMSTADSGINGHRIRSAYGLGPIFRGNQGSQVMFMCRISNNSYTDSSNAFECSSTTSTFQLPGGPHVSAVPSPVVDETSIRADLATKPDLQRRTLLEQSSKTF